MKTEDRPAFFARWWIYQRERFPIFGHGPLIAAFSFCAVSYSHLLRTGRAEVPPWPALAVAFVTCLGFFLQLRIADEFKDFEEDARYRPYRPVPRGLISLRELGGLFVLVGAVQLTAALLLAPRLALLLLLPWLYLAAMSKEFWVRDWLKARPITYLWTHMLIMPLVDFYATGCDWLASRAVAPRGLFLFLGASFFNGVVIEVGRKLRAPADEERGVPTYTKLWGLPRAVCVWLAVLGATFLFACGAGAELGRKSGYGVEAVLLVVFILALTFAIRFLRDSTPGAGKRFELLSGLWTLALYLSLGLLPLFSPVKFILHMTEPHSPATAGGKASALAALAALEFPIPPWFVVMPVAFYGSLGGRPAREAAATVVPSAGVEEAIREALVLAPANALFAVRSSAVDEDGADHSFAGQLESYLNVTAAEVPARVAEVWRSGFTERVLAYRRERGLAGEPQPPAVLVQQMVRAEAAGVVFSADPVSERRGLAIVSAVRGLGDKLVSGETDGDTFQVARGGTVISSIPVDPAAPVISSAQAVAVAELAWRAQQSFGRPQDIEWALERGRLWLLQSRPITTLGARPDPDGALRIWDNSNIAESYGGITTPLTFTFARRAYEEVYRQFCRLMAVPAARIADHAETFRCMIGLLRGRVYYNLVSWYQVLALLPGYTVNRGFMEQMMGVKEPLPAEALPAAPAAGLLAKVRDGFLLARTVLGLAWNHLTLRGQIARFYARLHDALQPPVIPLAQLRPDELAARYRELESRLLTRWDAPLVNDFLAMIFYGVLRKLSAQWCGSPGGALANDLIRAQGGIISAEPPRRMKELAALVDSPAGASSPLLAALRAGDLAATQRSAPPAFRKLLDEYLEKFGDRCLDELKLESATLHDDPATLLQGIAALAANPPRALPPEPAPLAKPGGWWRGIVFRWVLRNARERVRDRENLRFERTRLFGRVRRIFVELGRRFHADGLLADPRDIFLLTLDEALGFCDGTSPTTDLRGLAALRGAEFERWRGMPVPTDRCETRGVVNHAHDFQAPRSASPQAPPADGAQRTGLGCCPGVVRGKVRVIREPRGAALEPGEILVAERTDPGWVLLFPAASGLLVGRGSLLSHSAIVSRELGLPGIVSIPGLMAWLQTGDWVELDGSTGLVRRIAE